MLIVHKSEARVLRASEKKTIAGKLYKIMGMGMVRWGKGGHDVGFTYQIVVHC